jgi:CheY-like chemotaxis protein
VLRRLRHIVVVEDSDEDFATVEDAALRGDMLHPIVRARSGGAYLDQLQSSPRNRDALPLLLLLDLHAPGDDGRDVLRQLRSDDALRNMPVVVLSASANPRDVEFCYANGANAYHVKPVDHALHLKVLQGIFAYWLGSAVLTD